MLMGASRRRAGGTPRLVVTGLAAIVGLLAFAVPAPAAAAATCQNLPVLRQDGTVAYERRCQDAPRPAGERRPSGHPADGPAPDPCDLREKGGPPGSYCVGQRICYVDPTADPARYGPLPGPPATSPARYAVQMCLARANMWDETLTRPVFDRVILVGPESRPRDLRAEALEAFGELDAPPAGIGFSPPGRAVVNVPTWFWTTGFPAEPLAGSSALGLRAVATRDTTVWDFGDGTTLSCPGGGTPYARGASSACTHLYTRSSAGQRTEDARSLPAYPVTVTRRWTVAFTLDGRTVPIAGAPEVFTRTDSVPVPVAEIQSVVGDRR
jgi:hypothetical protein